MDRITEPSVMPRIPDGNPGLPVAGGEPEKATDGWYRELKDGRIEVMLKTPGLRVRSSGPADYIWQLVEHFEEHTGKRFDGDWKRPSKRGAKQIEGQQDIFMDQRSSDGE